MIKSIFLSVVTISLFLFPNLESKIRFLTFHYNKPDFLELQIKTFEKFIEDDYELFVFNDAPTHEMAEAIQNICNRYGTKCIRYEQEWHRSNPVNAKILAFINDPKVIDVANFGKYADNIGNQNSLRHSHVIQFALDHFGYDHNDLVVIIDGDMFPIRSVNLRDLQKNYDVIGIYRFFPKINVGYFWVPLISLNMPLLPNKSDLKFDLDVINGYLVDTGSSFHHYLEKNPQLSVKKFSPWDESDQFVKTSLVEMKKRGFSLLEAKLCKKLPTEIPVQFHLDHRFLHYGASSFNYANYDQKSTLVVEFLNAILNDN